VRLLLDTHVFLWWRLDDPKLSIAARDVITNPVNVVHVSAAVGWEIAIKRALGRLEFAGTVADALAEEGFGALDIRMSHTDRLSALPTLHRDPFDRIQIAQAATESMTLVTHDPAILTYPGVSLLAV
jgi:PIN domain nuclease of toxin-antitoxin system